MFRKTGLFGAVLLILAVASDYALSAPPLKWEWRQKLSNIAATERTMRPEAREKIRKTLSESARQYGAVASSTSVRVVVVRVEFTDVKFTTTYQDDVALIQQFTKYYSENSYGGLTVAATVSGSVYPLLHPEGYYASDQTNGPTNLLSDTLAATGSLISTTSFDYVMIMHAGNGEEMSGVSTDIWSQYVPDNFTANDGTKFTVGFTVVPEKAPETNQSPLSVMCHEFGHQLGLPDLYNTSVSGGSSVCGAWALMDYPYGADNTGRYPPHLDPWCKNFLRTQMNWPGFLDLSTRVLSASNSGLTWNYIETSQNSGFYKFPIAVASPSEYFVIEFRSLYNTAASFDKGIPGSGLLIWHIDDAIALDSARLYNNDINTGAPHYGVMPVPAGAKKFPPGLSTDPFGQGQTFVAPLSNSFSGTESGIVLSNISFAGMGVSAALAEIASNPSIGILKSINYPNPAGVGYPHPRSSMGVLTTIVLKATRPAHDLDMTLYSLSGEKVKSVSKTSINLNTSKSKDYDWFYEYDWDGKNDKGEDVAPGVYFYRIKADSEISVGKLAIVR